MEVNFSAVFRIRKLFRRTGVCSNSMYIIGVIA